MKKKIVLLSIIICAMVVAFWQLSKKPKIVSDDSIIVGTNPEFPPFEFKENDTLIGFDIDLINLIGKGLKKKINIKEVSFDVLIPATQIGSIQIIASGMTPTKERAQRILFTKPYLTSGFLCIVTRTNNPLETVEALQGKEIVVTEASTADLYMSKIEGVNLTRLQTTSDCFLALTSGRAEVFVASKNSIAPLFEKKSKSDFNVAAIPGTSESSALGVSKKHGELLPKIQAVLDQLEQDGTIKALKEKWKLN